MALRSTPPNPSRHAPGLLLPPTMVSFSHNDAFRTLPFVLGLCLSTSFFLNPVVGVLGPELTMRWRPAVRTCQRSLDRPLDVSVGDSLARTRWSAARVQAKTPSHECKM